MTRLERTPSLLDMGSNELLMRVALVLFGAPSNFWLNIAERVAVPLFGEVTLDMGTLHWRNIFGGKVWVGSTHWQWRKDAETKHGSNAIDLIIAFGKANSPDKATAWIRENASRIEAIAVPDPQRDPPQRTKSPEIKAALRVPITDILPPQTFTRDGRCLMGPCPNCDVGGDPRKSAERWRPKPGEIKLDADATVFVGYCCSGDVIDFVTTFTGLDSAEAVDFLNSPFKQFIRGLITEHPRYFAAAEAVGMTEQQFPESLRLAFILAMEGPNRVQEVLAQGKYDENTRAVLAKFTQWDHVKLGNATALAKRIIEKRPTDGAGKLRSREDRAKWFDQLERDLALKRITSNDYAVGVAIGKHVNLKTGEAFPGYGTLAKKTGRAINTARKAVKKLADRGHLRIKGSKPLTFVPVLHPVGESHDGEGS
jgi:hypothetical protein